MCVWALGLSACAVPTHSSVSGDTARASAMPAPAASMVGTRWKGVDASADERHLPWLEFVAEGRLSGFTGCNLLHGAWTNEGGVVRIGPLVTTKRGCVGAEGDTERLVLAVLTPRARVTREGHRLVFTGPGGERLEFVEAK
ncbi:MAG: META domain-containing protein [Usitatibacter sp.]